MVRAVVVSILSMALAGPAWANAIDFNVSNKVLAGGKERPSIRIDANEAVEQVEVVLTRDDGKVFKHRTGKLKPGAQKVFPIEIGPGPERHFKGSLAVVVGGQEQSADFEFDAELVVPAQVSFDKKKVDLTAHRLELTSTRETSKVEVEVTSDQGTELTHTEIPFEEAAPGTPLQVQWEQAAGTVLKIALKVHDPDGFYTGLEIYPWHLEIPHQEVNFATNSAAIEKAEQPKLDTSFLEVVDAVSRYGRWAQIKLYIAGHTDTVGDPASNRRLSVERARAISRYFRSKGLRIPIFYEGFGEEALKVATPDETDELQNRRVDYVVAIEPPALYAVEANWKPLR